MRFVIGFPAGGPNDILGRIIAQWLADKLGQPFNVARLLDDPVYNVTLGSAYYERVRSSFDGSHLLAVASYSRR